MQLKFLFQKFPLIFFPLLLFVSCNQSQKKGNETTTPEVTLPSSTGDEFQILVVTDSINDNQAFKDSLSHVMYEKYPDLPHSENWFRLAFTTINAFGRLRERQSDLLFITTHGNGSNVTDFLSDQFSKGQIEKAYNHPQSTLLEKDNVWASPQRLIFLPFTNIDSLFSYLREYHTKIYQRFDQMEKNRIFGLLYPNGGMTNLTKKFQKEYNFTLKIPISYRIAKDLNDPAKDSSLKKQGLTSFTWLRNETSKTSNDILIYIQPYKGTWQLTEDSIVKLRNRAGKAFVPAGVPGSYLSTETDTQYVKPQFHKISLNGLPAVEYRGLWETEGDFKGGPFVNFTIPDSMHNRVITIDGFIYAPGTPKLPFMKRIEVILSTFHLTGTNAK